MRLVARGVGVASLLVGVAIATGFVAVSTVAQPKPPEDFPMARADSSPGQVTFSHQAHLKKVEKCTTCHMKDFKMKRGASGPITLAAKQEGKFCGSCHDGKTRMGDVTVFPIDECDRCHTP